MYTLFEHYTIRDLLVREAPGMAVALVIAELFYKFHSFVLECLAFLTTWFLLSLLLRSVLPERGQAGPLQPTVTRRDIALKTAQDMMWL